MPLFEEDNIAPVEVRQNVQSTEYKDIRVNLNDTPLNALMTHVSGSKWVIDYYSQYLTPDMETSAQEENMDPLYQQYLKIVDMEVRVTSPLTGAQNPENSEFTYTGSATLYVGIVPNIGDMFVADMGGGRYGIFVIKLAEQKSIFKDTVYTIDYELKDYYDGVLKTDLEEKVVKTQHFIMDLLKLGKRPFLTSDEYTQYGTIAEYLAQLPTAYFISFFNQEFNTFLVPGQEDTMYDPLITEFIYSQVSKTEFPKYTHVKLLNVDNDKNLTMQTVLDALMERDDTVLLNASVKSSVLAARSYCQLGRYSTVRYSGIQKLYYPKNIASALGVDLEEVLITTPDPVFFGGWAGDVLTPTIANDEGLILFHPVTLDDYYIFSEAFYMLDSDNMSEVEKTVVSYLLGESIVVDTVLVLAHALTFLSVLDRYYYTPIIMLLLQASFTEIS